MRVPFLILRDYESTSVMASNMSNRKIFKPYFDQKCKSIKNENTCECSSFLLNMADSVIVEEFAIRCG